jgi:hypothetical protein
MDFLGHRHQQEMIVIAGDEEKAKKEVAAYFHLHDEVENWRIIRIQECKDLKPDDPHALDYRNKGVHSYISPWLSGGHPAQDEPTRRALTKRAEAGTSLTPPVRLK